MFAVEQHFLSHAMQLADALIGSTAIAHGIPLLTGKVKHYKKMREEPLIPCKPGLNRGP